MRLTCAIGGALLLMCAAPTGQAAEATTPRPAAACDAPVANPGAVKPVVHHYRRVYRRAPVRLVSRMPPPPPPLNYNIWLPGPYESGYDRFMTLHFRTPAVSGVYGLDSGNLTATPPVPAVQPYRMEIAAATVVQYDGLTGQYIQLSQYDAHRVVAPLPAMPPAQ